MNYKQIYAIKKSNEQRVLKVNPRIPKTSGIYILTRFDEDFKYAYIGQAKSLLERLAGHLTGFKQHIDLSIRKHGLFGNENPMGWDINFIECRLEELDTKEQEYIKKYADLGYQLRNRTSGSQGKGKRVIVEADRKGYRKGVEYGYLKARKEISELLKRVNYTFEPKKNKNGSLSVNSKNALNKLNEIIGGLKK